MNTVDEITAAINAKGWFVNNLFQIADVWRCNLQKRKTNGATEAIFTEFADGKTAVEALSAAAWNANARAPEVDKKIGRSDIVDTLTGGQMKRLILPMANLTAALKVRTDGTRGKD